MGSSIAYINNMMCGIDTDFSAKTYVVVLELLVNFMGYHSTDDGVTPHHKIVSFLVLLLSHCCLVARLMQRLEFPLEPIDIVVILVVALAIRRPRMRPMQSRLVARQSSVQSSSALLLLLLLVGVMGS